MQINKHWANNSCPEMTTKKLQNLASCAIGVVEKVRILKLWNSSKAQRLVNMFPIGPFSMTLYSTRTFIGMSSGLS
jgi:hypothetical protein